MEKLEVAMRPRCSAGEIGNPLGQKNRPCRRNEAPVFCRGNLKVGLVKYKKYGSQ